MKENFKKPIDYSDVIELFRQIVSGTLISPDDLTTISLLLERNRDASNSIDVSTYEKPGEYLREKREAAEISLKDLSSVADMLYGVSYMRLLAAELGIINKPHLYAVYVNSLDILLSPEKFSVLLTEIRKKQKIS